MVVGPGAVSSGVDPDGLQHASGLVESDMEAWVVAVVVVGV